MRLPDMGCPQAAPPGEHDVVFIQHLRHKLADANGMGMLPNGSQQQRASALALKLIRHGKGDLGGVSIFG